MKKVKIILILFSLVYFSAPLYCETLNLPSSKDKEDLNITTSDSVVSKANSNYIYSSKKTSTHMRQLSDTTCADFYRVIDTLHGAQENHNYFLERQKQQEDYVKLELEKTKQQATAEREAERIKLINPKKRTKFDEFKEKHEYWFLVW